MTIYRLHKYLEYLLRAKGRHGTHSPFVYAFVEDVLLRSAGEQELLRNMQAYYSIDRQHQFPLSSPFTFGELTVMDIGDYRHEKFYQHGVSDIIVLKDIYANPDAEAAWKNAYMRPEATLSLDLYRIGILFFRKEFLEKQHFVLKF